MKLQIPLLCVVIAFAFAVAPAQAGDLPSEPVISSIHGKRVTVTVPAGFDSITLQTLKKTKRERGQPRVEQWRTVETKFPRGEAATYTFRLGKLTPKRNLRAFGRSAETLPSAFFTGMTHFAADPIALRTTDGNSTLDGAVNREAFGPTDLFTTSAVSTTNAATREVVESDIWKLAGDRLYFFNQLRGLQVFDVKNPDAPALLGTLRMPAVGEDMYLLGENHAVLLKRDWSLWSDWWWGDILPFTGGGVVALAADSAVVSNARTVLATTQEATRSNEVVIVDVTKARPVAMARLPFAGSLVESRLVGSVLYVAASINREIEDSRGIEYGTEITAFDLSDPAHPARRNSIFVSGWTNTVAATDRFFMLTGQNANGAGSSVELIDISSADGTMRRAGRAVVEGWISDKFKLSLAGDVLTTISSGATDTGGSRRFSQPVTILQTFSIADPDAPAALGRVEIAPGETVRATRFDAGLAYVVTFRQIDPLFVIDLRDPAAPKIAGHLEVPGFSTYIEPLGDRLVTIGLVSGKPAVSLFDVSDPENPALLTQLELAGKEWSSSVAVWDEKAFNVLPEQNLILLPIERGGFDVRDAFGGRWFEGVQLIDLRRDSLVQRGVIEHGFSPRRAGVKDERIISISPTRLVVADAEDRDAPVVKADLEIAWRVDRVFHLGDYLVQLGSSADWANPGPQTISVARANDPDDTLTVETLADFPVVGSALRNGVLYVAQQGRLPSEIPEVATSSADRSRLSVSAYDLSALPKIRFLSRATSKSPVSSWAQLEALWPSPGTLVWVVDGSWRWWSRPLPIGAATASGDSIGGTSKRFIAFDVSAPEKIRFGSEVELGGNRPLIFSRAFASAGLVYVSAKQLGAGWLLAGDGDSAPGNDARADRNFLRVIEYNDPAAPYLRPNAVNLPGALRGVARAGKILYTAGQGYDPKTNAPKPGKVVLHASAFDGEAAHLLGTFPLGAFISPVALAGDRVFTLDEEPAYLWSFEPRDPITLDVPMVAADDFRFFWPGYRTPNPRHSRLHELALRDDDGALEERASLELEHDHGLDVFGNLVVTAPGTQDLRLIDASAPDALDDLGVASFDGWVWPILDGADGSLEDGLWVPVGNYGVEQVTWEDPTAANP
ncbi:MAG: beta-propeller domain-containing protein [Chthoniobacteraceae bacterium]